MIVQFQGKYKWEHCILYNNFLSKNMYFHKVSSVVFNKMSYSNTLSNYTYIFVMFTYV